MKRLLLTLGLIAAWLLGNAQNFTPEVGVFYNIKQTISDLVVGPSVSAGVSSTQPSVVALTNKKSQAFEFIPVDGKPGIYYMLNGEGMYLNMYSADAGNYWTSIFEAASNDLYSEWTIEGDNEVGFRLKLSHNNLYLASDNITDGSALYTDKGVDHANGLFKAQVATIDDRPEFVVLEKGMIYEVEVDGNPYPVRIYGKDHTYDIQINVPDGFYVDKTTLTPADFVATSGNVKVEVYALGSAVHGELFPLTFSYERGGNTEYLDTIQLTAVEIYPRYYMKHKTSNFVIGNHSGNEKHPALTEIIPSIEEGGYLQQFLLRKVNPQLDDSLYYIIQDATYAMMRKVPSSNWDVEWGYYSPEAVWKMYKREDGIWEVKNNMTGKWLGTDGLTVDSRLYDDKTFVLNATAKPYSEWFFVAAGEMFDETDARLSTVTISTGVLEPAFDPEVTTYDVLSPVDVEQISISAKASSLSATINNNDAVLESSVGSIDIECVSGDGEAIKVYTFNYKAIGFEWDARGETSAARSVPSQWGWKCANASWVAANSTAAGTVRYVDNPAGYYSLGDTLNTGVNIDTIPFAGRIMFVRWDGNVTTAGVYSYPVMLAEGKSYTFKGQYAWNSVIPADVSTTKLTIGFNSMNDNSGTVVASNEYIVESTKLLELNNAEFTFSVPASGLYYLTIASDATILAALANLEIVGLNTSVDNTQQEKFSAITTAQAVIVRGVEAGELIRIYNVSGQIVSEKTALLNETSFTLGKGIYFVKVNQEVVKVIR
ncbi:MAG: T9SS type A sorting domain-containing protein [Paludibacteraceae bacterium]|nr:T9SS type A sorting domain-containing protein [Paludibacteraceae bacterium]